MQIQKHQNIEFLRFIMSIIIVYFHMIGSNISKYVSNPIYNELGKLCNNSYLCVEMFFIIAGFFLYKSSQKEISFSKFTIDKIARLWPMLFASIVITLIFKIFHFNNANGYTLFINSFFLQSIGVSLDYKGINWFISPFFWVMLFYFYLAKNYKEKNVLLAISLLVYFSLVGLINRFNGGFGRETFEIFFNGGVCRALSHIGIGFLIGKALSNIEFKKTTKKDLSFFIISLIEITICGFILYHFLAHPITYSNKLIFSIIFCILFICFIAKKGIISQLLENNVSQFLGKYSYSLYVMQQCLFWLLGATLWKSKTFVDMHPIINISLSLMLSFIISMGLYHIIEKPAQKLLKNKLSKIIKEEK